MVQGEQTDRRDPRRSGGGQSTQPAHASDKVLHRGGGRQDDPVDGDGLGLPRPGLSEDLGHLHRPGGPQQPDPKPIRLGPGHGRRGRRHGGGL